MVHLPASSVLHLFYNGGLWEKYFLGFPWDFLAAIPGVATGKNESKNENESKTEQSYTLNDKFMDLSCYPSCYLFFFTLNALQIKVRLITGYD